MRCKAAKGLFCRQQKILKAVLGCLIGSARADLGVGGKDFLASFRIHQSKAWLLTAPSLWVEWDLPATFSAAFAGNTLPINLVIEEIEDFLAVLPQCIEQGRDRQFALTVNPDIDDVFGVKFEIEPRAAVRNDPSRKQKLARTVGLAAIMVEQNTRRTVHLRYNHTLCAIDNESAIIRHERHIAHVNVLLFNIENRAGFGFLIDLKHDEAQGHFHRRSIGDPALLTLCGVMLRRLKFVMDEIKLCRARKIADWKDTAQGLFKAGNIARFLVRAQELLIAFALNLNEVGHIDDFVNITEDLTNAALGCALRHAFGPFCFSSHECRCLILS